MSIASKILDFIEQPCENTCQAAAIARVIGSTDVMEVRRSLLTQGRSRGLDAGNPYLMGEIIKPRVREYQYFPDASLEQAKEALTEGYHLITHGWFTRAGHVIGISPFEDGEPYKPHPTLNTYAFNCEDPWYRFHFPTWTYTRLSGNNVPYSAFGMYASCVASNGFGHAQQLYRRGELNSNLKNMWLHLIKN
jgi:hypothetical protein